MRLFVTGTDTHVGKTVVTCCLARAAGATGTVLAAKPVASGVVPGTDGEDAAQIAHHAGHLPQVFAAYEAPLSPHRAALLEGRTLDARALRDWVSALDADTVIVEGVGGWRVPIHLSAGPRPSLWVADLARATGGPVVVVAADRLGVLNHALLTLEAVRADGFAVAAVVLNRGVPEDASRRTNLEDLTALAGVPVVPLPHVDLGDAAAVREAGAALLRVIVGGEHR